MKIETFWYLLRHPTHGTEWERKERTSFCRTIVATAKSSGLRHSNRCRWDEIWSEQFPDNVYALTVPSRDRAVFILRTGNRQLLLQSLRFVEVTSVDIPPAINLISQNKYLQERANAWIKFVTATVLRSRLLVYVYFGHFIKIAIGLIDLSFYTFVSSG